MLRKLLFLFMLLTGMITSVYGQKGQVKGRVTDEKNSPLPGVSVSVKGTHGGTMTDKSGYYSISIPDNAVLYFSYIGYLSKEVPVNHRDSINVSLSPKDNALGEVVITGMGNKLDRRLYTGATTQISGEAAHINGMADPSRGLEGKVAGVTVQNVTGTFGTAPRIRIRGATSIYGNSKPLWVLDGVILEDVADVSADALSSGDALTLISSAVAGLNPNDIESFQILKDGSATSIYGAKAMSGVIVITTKKGSAGRSSMNYVSELTYRIRPSYNNFNIMNSQEQMAFYQEMERRGWLRLSTVSNGANSGVYGKMFELVSAGKLLNTDAARNAYLREAEYRNTDWFDMLFNNNIVQNHSVSLSSGSAKSQYYTSASAMTDPGWTPQSKVNRYTFLLNANYNILDNLKLNLIGNGSFRDQRAPGTLGQAIDVVAGEVKRDFDINPYLFAMTTSRTLDPNTYYTRNYAPFNIMQELSSNYMQLKATDLKFQGELKWKIIPGLEVAALGAFRYQSAAQQHQILDNSNQALAYRAQPTTVIRDLNPFLYKDPTIPYAVPVPVMPEGGIYQRYDYGISAKDFRFTVQYDKIFNEKHTFNLFAGTTINNTERRNTWFRGWGMQYGMGEIPFVDYLVFKKGQEENAQYYSLSNTRSREAAFFGTVNYNFDRRYTINGTLRYEGSNRLGKATSARWLPTWNISGAWNIHEEKFFEQWKPALSTLTLRASYSLTADRGPAFVTNSQVVINSYNPWRPNTPDNESGLRIETLQNSGLTYEKKHELNLGLNAGFFNNRLNITADVFRRNNFDLIGEINTQGVGGEILKYGNIADMKSSGMELGITGDIIQGKRFSWTSNLTYTHVTTKVTNLKTSYRVIDLISGNGFAQVGRPSRGLYSIPFLRLNNEGLPVFLDQNMEETTTGAYFQERDKVDFLKYEGPTDPTDFGGFGNTLTYKNFRLNVFVTYSFGNVIRLAPVFRTEYTDLSALPQELKNRWVVPGDEEHTDIPAIASKRQTRTYTDLKYGYNAYNFSTARIARGDFIRMKDVSLTYSFPKEKIERLKMNSLSLRVNATNLFLIYADKNLYGQDPEFVNVGGVAAPLPRQVTFTLNVGF
ncbi:SusC/RagA family TonB-linked outer membrane protein [Chitinophaga sp. OAE865]|uniref:SusC/RagA family TonB-linked outer membrane protein n=1 Tax=Chitinophaga sp. OAE865 TaxID=2817898 RepID=UPI001AE14806